jgi:predicted HTH transcriptional regulator
MYVKEEKTLKLQACPANPKDFPVYEKKVRAALQKIDMHHLLDHNVTTTEANHDASAKLASALLLSFSKEHMKWFMGAEGEQYEERGIEMWQYLRAKILDEEDEDELYDRLLHPKMGTDESPLDYKLKLEQALHAAKAKQLHINIHQVICAASNGLDLTHYQPLLDSYTVKNKMFESLDTMVTILEKFDKHPHVKASRKAKTDDNKSKTLSPVTLAPNVTPTGTTLSPTPAPPEIIWMIEDIRKIHKKKKCLVCGGSHFAN